MARLITIAAAQLPAWTEGHTPEERKRFRLIQVEHWLHVAGQANADIVCLGEIATTYGISAPADDRNVFEEAYGGPSALVAGGLARRYGMVVVLPIAAWHGGRFQNLALVFNRQGNIVGHFAKVHLTRSEAADGIVAGNDFPVFDLDFGRIGIVICHDLSFPEATRVLAVRGAEVIFWPTMWSGWGEELCTAVIKSRAIDNAAYLVQASYGQPGGKAWRPGMVLGNSGVTGPDGLTRSSAGRYVGLALASIDLDQPRLAHSFGEAGEGIFRDIMLADRQPAAYAPLTDRTLVPPRQRDPVWGCPLAKYRIE